VASAASVLLMVTSSELLVGARERWQRGRRLRHAGLLEIGSKNDG